MATKEWRPFTDFCAYCGGEAEVLTSTGRDNWAQNGDVARCTNCGCPGFVHDDGREHDDCPTGSIDWHDGTNCECDWCKKHPV